MRLTQSILTKSIQNASPLQKLILTLGSGLIAINDPARADMINAFGELTGTRSIKYIHNQMKQDPEGAQILNEKPLINSTTVNLKQLATMPSKSFGREYVEFLERNGIHPDSRLPVSFIEDDEMAYVMNRYRQIHDFTHCILGMKTNMLGKL